MFIIAMVVMVLPCDFSLFNSLTPRLHFSQSLALLPVLTFLVCVF